MVSSKRISMEAERIKVVKDWLELKSVCNIQVFLGFANFHWQLIQGFSSIAAPFTSMLKITGSPNKATPSKINGSKSVSSRNNNNKPAFGRNNGNGEVDGFSVGENGVKNAKKSGKTSKSQKLSKSRKLSKSEELKSKKTSKSQNLAKSGKKLSKIGNSINFNAMEDGPKFLTLDAKTAFNCLQLAFTKAPILKDFDSECHI